MERAWPFEGVPEGGRNLRSPEDFLAAYGPGIEAVVVRIGLHDAQLVLVDSRGWWQRWVYHSVEETTAVAESLRIPVHVGEYPEEMRVRMNAFRRPAEDFDKAAYPEQGMVGPVIPYPENRPRRLEDPRREADRQNPKT
ncbi:MAG: hypothetical protein M3271_01880 [Actinomycetota bacterium]|nr:hypothetical protein [Actinomycetota bacterium]